MNSRMPWPWLVAHPLVRLRNPWSSMKATFIQIYSRLKLTCFLVSVDIFL
eukprot:m.4604 g.4604  ORF g.4604 m.4604 type:complete len:50 (+) comp11004_c0_seq1:987-1136(+)